MALSPMMRHYLEVKEANPDCIVLYRLGDFYEMFFEDAKLISRELELTLTGRDCGLEERAPMCGVPYHAVDNYIARMIEFGHKVAICEQLQDPKEATGLVDRGIVRIITPGTATVDSEESVYIMSVVRSGQGFGAAYADVSTGEFVVGEYEDSQKLQDLISRVSPKEFLVAEGEKISELGESTSLSEYFPYAFETGNAVNILKEHFGVADISIYGVSGMDAGIRAAGALMRYLYETQKNVLMHITRMTADDHREYMIIDAATKRNLELTLSMREMKKRGSLLWLLDKTKTAMGGRLIRNWIEQPLISMKEISRRHSAVAELCSEYQLRLELRDRLSDISDVEKLLSRISYGNMDARHALSLKMSVQRFKGLKESLVMCRSDLLKKSYEDLDPLEDLANYLERAVSEDPPIGIRDGGIIKNGFSKEVDDLRNAGGNAKKWIAELEQKERERTGIKTLRVGYNRVFGYYLEVTRSFLDLVPQDYIRKQTLANAERYITPELKELEDSVTHAEERLKKIEEQLFLEVRSRIADNIETLQKDAKIIAELDVLLSFAQVAYDNDYCRPKMTNNGEISIKAGRHPVVEKSVRQEFVPNDTYMNNDTIRMLVITGPNMGGKSTFMRQTALIVLMAHIGSFVPAESATICLVDRIFTRVGASDDLAQDQSTFMVEMSELAGILMNATPRSLLVLDEIGRGTSTQDGLAIAWATIEHIIKSSDTGYKTLFATHFHELADLEGNMPGVVNYSVGVKELDKTVLFLHRIKRGGADRSFGIEVARLAGLPESLLERAKGLLGIIESNSDMRISSLEISEDEEKKKEEAAARVIGELRALDINTITPMEAMVLLDDLKRKASRLEN